MSPLPTTKSPGWIDVIDAVAPLLAPVIVFPKLPLTFVICIIELFALYNIALEVAVFPVPVTISSSKNVPVTADTYNKVVWFIYVTFADKLALPLFFTEITWAVVAVLAPVIIPNVAFPGKKLLLLLLLIIISMKF